MKPYVFVSIVLLQVQLDRTVANKIRIDVRKEVKSINGADLPWKATTYGQDEMDWNEFVDAKLGAIINGKPPAYRDPKKLIQMATIKSNVDKVGLPVNFTWADPNNTNCPIRHIRDQSNCGSCWAISTVSTFGDRLCIQSKGKINVTLSQEFVTTCNKENTGCKGGRIDIVNNFMVKNGTITGGDYDSDVGCQMYTIRPCGFPRLFKMQCDRCRSFTPRCHAKKCNNDWYSHETEPETNVFKAKSWFYIKSNFTHSREDRIREEIFRNGPVMAAFFMQLDLALYEKGVFVPCTKYQSNKNDAHQGRVVGWGVENGLKYWHVANSWGTHWGEKGFFRIIRGVDALGFEQVVTALVPKL